MAEQRVKGFLIAKFLEKLRKELGDEVLAEVEKELGVTLRQLKTAFFSDYPVALQIAVEQRFAKLVWKESYETAVYRIGRLNFTSFSESTFGRTALAVVGKDPKKLLKGTVRLISTVTSGLDIEAADRGEKEFSLRFRNSIHRPLGWKGTIDAALEHTGITPTVRIAKHGLNDNEFIISWP